MSAESFVPLSRAFGTDRLLEALQGAGIIDEQRLANSFLQLIKWRYRFIVAPTSVLMTLARRFASRPPGTDLQLLARYVHDCMRDEGLFAGLEPTSPPTTIGNRLYQTWTGVVAEMMVDVWDDAAFSDDSARTLTLWATAELLPSPPKSMGPAGALLPSFRAKLVLSRAMIRSARIRKRARAFQALATISEGLGLAQEEYLSTVVEVLNVI